MNIFGSQLEFASKVIRAKQRPVDAGSPKKEIEKRLELATQYSKVVMQIVVSLVVLVCSFIVLFKFDQNSDLQKAATGFIGAIVGYWLK